MPQYTVTIFVLKVSVMSFILKCEQYQKSQFVMADPVLQTNKGASINYVDKQGEGEGLPNVNNTT